MFLVFVVLCVSSWDSVSVCVCVYENNYLNLSAVDGMDMDLLVNSIKVGSTGKQS